MPCADAKTQKRSVSLAEVYTEEYDQLDPSSADETESTLIAKPRRWRDVTFGDVPGLSAEERAALSVRNGRYLYVFIYSVSI